MIIADLSIKIRYGRKWSRDKALRTIKPDIIILFQIGFSMRKDSYDNSRLEHKNSIWKKMEPG